MLKNPLWLQLAYLFLRVWAYLLIWTAVLLLHNASSYFDRDWVDKLISRLIIWTSLLLCARSVFAACRHHQVFITPSAQPGKQQTGVSVLPLEWVDLFAWNSHWQQSACVSSVCVRQRVNTPTFTSSLVWILSLFPSSRQLFYVCLLFQRLSWLPHTRAVGEASPPVFQRNKMNGTHTPLRSGRDT